VEGNCIIMHSFQMTDNSELECTDACGSPTVVASSVIDCHSSRELQTVQRTLLVSNRRAIAFFGLPLHQYNNPEAEG
jgi:hypothetical protein